MTAFLVTSISGFFTAFLVGFTVCLPYLLRRQAALAGQTPRFGLHYCVGYTIVMVLLLHMFVSMQAGMARGTSLTGLNIATLALLLVTVQVFLGVTLIGKKQRGLRAWHFLVMTAIVALAAMHVVLNSVLLRGMLGG
jgi:hypothetical protein